MLLLILYAYRAARPAVNLFCFFNDSSILLYYKISQKRLIQSPRLELLRNNLQNNKIPTPHTAAINKP